MRRPNKTAITCLGIAVLLLLIGFLAKPPSSLAFRKYVVSPVPKTIRTIRFEGNDYCGLMFQAQCFFYFSGSRSDVLKVAEDKGFKAVEFGNIFAHPNEPSWFTSPIGTNGRFYARRPPRYQSWWSGKDWLWIDATGTNAFFQHWRMD